MLQRIFNSKLISLQLVCVSAVSLIACSGGLGSSSTTSSDSTTLQAVDAKLTLMQNSRASVNLDASIATSLTITQSPVHGVVVVDGTTVTYRLTDPLYFGTDSFKYKLTHGQAASNEATVRISVTAAGSGSHVFTENYTGSNYDLSGWTSHSSSFAHTVNSVTGFDTATFNSVTMPSRHFGIYGEITSYAGDAAYKSLFSVLPVDGAGGAMQDWPWKAELIHQPACGSDATVLVKMVSNGGQYPMGGILLNYDIETTTEGATQLTGYQVLFNGGGGSLTLSRFNKADSLATAYLDRWPNTTYGNEAMTNPVEYGPYKGWNYRNGVWPAGGNMGVGSNWLLAARYTYDANSNTTTVSYEARQIDGTDLTPGTWDHVITLTGADSLPSGGSFGVMGTNYHTNSMLQTTDFELVEYKLNCELP